MTTSQIKSTVDFKDYKVWKMKDGIKATLVESDINTTVRLHDGSQKDIKADRYILIEWSPKLSLILEIPETHQKDPAAWVAKMNKAGQVDLRRGWGKVFPQAEQYDFQPKEPNYGYFDPIQGIPARIWGEIFSAIKPRQNCNHPRNNNHSRESISRPMILVR